MEVLKKIEKANLTGRGGAGCPTAFKWSTALKTKEKNLDSPLYIICNATEGEPGIEKDSYLLEYHPDDIINGIKIAIETLGAKEAIIYLQQKNLKKVEKRLTPFIKDLPISFFPESGGYLCGEETTLLETIEGYRAEPRIKPPYPTEDGLYGCPTVINNVETFYYVSKIIKGEYQHTRLCSISGQVKNPGVFEIPIDLSIKEILKKTKNIPKSKFFVQVGGGAAGTILMQDEFDQSICGAGSIIVYNLKKTNIKKLMLHWIEFFYKSNCGKCVPCREGLYRVREQLKSDKTDWLIIRAILETMHSVSFCPLGKSVYEPLMSLMERIDYK